MPQQHLLRVFHHLEGLTMISPLWFSFCGILPILRLYNDTLLLTLTPKLCNFKGLFTASGYGRETVKNKPTNNNESKKISLSLLVNGSLTQVRLGDHVQVSVHRYEDRNRLVWCQNIRFITGITPSCEPHVIGVRKHNTIYTQENITTFTQNVWIELRVNVQIEFFSMVAQGVWEDISPFLWATFGLLVVSALGFKARVDPQIPASLPALLCDGLRFISECITCWHLRSQL